KETFGEPMKQPSGMKIALSANGKVLASAYSSLIAGQAQLWDAATGKPFGQAMSHDGMIWSVTFSPDSKTLLTASGDNTEKLWEPAPGKLRGLIQHQARVRTADFPRDGSAVVPAGQDRTVRLWHPFTGKPLGPPLLHPASVLNAIFSPDGQ